MKLRTTIEKVQADGYEALRHDLEHDALAAHALLQAMEEWGEKEYGEAVDKLCVRWIRLRFDELMREWTTSEPSSNPR